MLKRKMFRDVQVNKVPFIAIFLMMFMGNFVFSGMTSEYHGMQETFNNYLNETAMADSWLYGMDFSDETLIQLNNIEGITNVEERMFVPTKVSGQDDQSMDLYIKKTDTISSMKIIEGISFDNNTNGIWLDYQFAKVNDIDLHDKIKLEYQGITIEKEVVGLGYQPEYIYNVADNELVPNHEKKGFALINEENFTYKPLIQYNQLLVKGEGNLKQAIEIALQDSNIQILMQKDHPSYFMINQEIQQHKEIGFIFVVAFLFIAILVTITTLHRLLSSQRIQIGVLKALGFKSHQLFFHYSTHSSLVCLLGSLCGWVLGYFALPPLLLTFLQPMYAVPNLHAILLPYSYLLPISSALLCLVISLWICRQYLCGNAADTLYGHRHIKKYKELPFAKVWKYLSFYAQWNGRDILRNKLRSIMTIFGVVGCVALLYGAFGLFTSMNQLTRWNMDVVLTYDTKLSGDFTNEVYTNNLLNEMNGEALMESNIELKTNDTIQTAALTVIESQNYIHLMKDYKHQITLNEGIALSKNIADSLKVKTGDTLQWKILGTDQWVESTITAIIRTPMNQGITIMKSELFRLDVPYQTTSLIGNPIDSSLINTYYTTTTQNRTHLQAGLNTMMEASMMMCGIFALAAIILGSVILYNLGSLSYNERYYEMSTLKVLGFNNERIRKLMIQQNIWLTIIGIIIGLPVGYQFIVVLLSTVQESIDVMIYLPTYVYVVTIFGTFVLSWLINKTLSRKVYHIDMVSALKANE